jgi:AraC-like DNA-binding protein
MNFIFDERSSDSPLVVRVWRTHSEKASTFISRATSQWEMVVTKHKSRTTFTVRGPETKASQAPVPPEAEFLGIQFKLGTFMPYLPTQNRVNESLDLPEASGNSFWLHGSAWQFPDFENADTFIARLMRDGLLVYDPIVDATLQGRPASVSLRSIQRRFVRATGLTHGSILQIERAHRSITLLQQGVSIIDTATQVGYADQPHLTRSLKRFTGQTPAQIIRLR